MPQHFLQPRVRPQVGKVVHPIAAQRIQHHKAFHHRGFVVAALPLLDLHMLTHAGQHAQGAKRLHHQRHAAPGGQGFLQRLIVQFKQQRRFGGRRFSGLHHAFIVTQHTNSP